MSLLGKKREKRENDDDKVRHNNIILSNLLNNKEYNQMFGIKEEEPQKEDQKNDNNDIPIEEEKKINKIENKDIKIIETTITLSSNERIKTKSYKKEKSKTEEKPITSSFPAPSEKVEKKIEKKEEKEKDKNISNNSNSIFSSIPVENPFKALSEKNNEKKEVISLFGIGNQENKDKKETNQSNSLFGNINNNNDNKNSGLFSNTFSFGPNKDKPLFSFSSESGDNKLSLFSNNNNNNNNNSLFSGNAGTSLFGNNNNNSLFLNANKSNDNNSTPLFPNNNISNPFSQIKGESFLNNILKNKDNKEKNNDKLFEENNDDGEDDERDKPKTKYDAKPLKSQDYTDYDKLYNFHLNNLFLFNKTEKKFISKGSGFFSIEKTKEEKSKTHQCVVVYRNQTGNKLVEGFLDKKFNKFDIHNKEFKYVVSFGIIMMGSGKPELGYLKIPFTSEEDANRLKKAFDEAIDFLDGK